MLDRLTALVLSVVALAAGLLVLAALTEADWLEALGAAVFLYGMLLALIHWLGVWSLTWAVGIATGVIAVFAIYRLMT